MGSSQQGQENRSFHSIMIYLFICSCLHHHQKQLDPDVNFRFLIISSVLSAWRGLFSSLSWGNLPPALIFSKRLPRFNTLDVLKRSAAERLPPAARQRPQRNHVELQQDGARRQWAWSFGGSAPGTPLPSTGCSMSYQRGCHNIPVFFQVIKSCCWYY